MDVGGNTIANLQIKVGADPTGATRDLHAIDTAFGKTEGAAEKAASKAEGFGSRMSKALGGALQFAAGGLIQKGIETVAGGITDFFSGAIDEAQGWNKAMAQTQAVVKSTGGAAGLTADQLGDLAASLSGANGVSLASDDAVLSAENMLLTFTNIGAKTFPRATQTALDMAQALGGDAAQQSVALGKALNDPIAGISALSRVGVTFTAQQKEQIKTMVAAGDTFGAQSAILDELQKEFGGSAAAAAKADGGAFKLSEQFANLKQTVGDALLPILKQAMGFLASDQVMGVLQGLADLVSQGLTQGFQFLMQVWAQLQGPLGAVAAALGSVGQAAGTLLGALAPVGDFLGQHWDAILLGIGTALTAALIPALIALGTTLITTTIPAFIAVAAPVLAAAAPFIALGLAIAALKVAFDNNFLGLKDLVQPVLDGIGQAVGNFIALLQQAFGPEGLKLDAIQALPGFLQPVATFLGTMAENAGEFFRALQGGTDPITAIGDLIQNNLVDALSLLGIKQADAVGAIDGFKTALGNVWAFIQDPVLPILGNLAGWVGEQIPKGVQLAADAWNNVLAPALSAAWSYIQANILPILGQAAQWLGENLPIALQKTADFWNTTLQPALSAVWAFTTNSLLPTLGTLAGTLIDTVGAAISGLADLWNNTLAPALQANWAFFTTYILPVLQAVNDIITKVVNLALTAMAGIFQNVILPAITAVWDFISKSLQPVFESLGGPGGPVQTTGDALSQVALIWNTVLSPALSGLWSMISSKLAPAFDGLKGAISGVIDFLNNLSNQLDTIQLPDWMTPGSPTPWELGLRGVLGVLGTLTGQGLPGLGGAIAAVMNQGGADGPLGPLVGAFQALPGVVGGITPQITSSLDSLVASLASTLTGSGGGPAPAAPGKKKGGLLGGIVAMATGGIKNPDSPGPQAAKGQGDGLGAQLTSALSDTFKQLIAQVDYQAEPRNEDSLAARFFRLLGLLGTRIDTGPNSLKAYASAALKGVLDLMLIQVDNNFPAITDAWQGYLNGLKALVDSWVSAINSSFANIKYPSPPGSSTPPGQTPPATLPSGTLPPPGANLPPGIKGNAAIFGAPSVSGAGAGGAVYNITINGLTVQAPAAVGEWLVAVAQHKQTRGRGLELKP